MSEKKKILIIGITMAAAGSEKSFLSFAETIDFTRYDVDLLLASREGEFLPQVPKQIRILDMGNMGALFRISRENAKMIILRHYVRANPFRLLGIFPYFLKIKRAKNDRQRSFASHRLWLHMMEKMPRFAGEYDIAMAYWGDRTMFYMVDKVCAKQKIAWLHFDYEHPPREDAIYEKYFAACDKVVTVSSVIEASLKKALPQIADRVIMLENRIDRETILRRAEEAADFGDDFSGIRLLTVGRIGAQKGYDLALGAVLRLYQEGYPIRWYIVGRDAGEPGYLDTLQMRIREVGEQKVVRFLGTRENPYPLMRAADIYLQPSRHEGKPIAVEEAKVLAKPILVTNYASAREQLADGTLGLICEISEDAIYQNLKKMLDEPNFRLELSQNNKKIIQKRNSTNDLFCVFETN